MVVDARNFMNTLDEIAIRHGTDKATVCDREHQSPHHYTPHYEKFFEPLRHEKIKILEIGVGGGESITTWLDYFTKAEVYGVDNVQGTNPWNTVGAISVGGRYKFVYGNQAHDVFWGCFIVDYGIDWDIIIDDGGHFNDQIITTFNCMYPVLRSGGLYCIEDLNCAYPEATSIFVRPGFPSHSAWMKLKIDAMNTGAFKDYDSIYFCKGLAIIRKA